jgi:hypothetical protein
LGAGYSPWPAAPPTAHDIHVYCIDKGPYGVGQWGPCPAFQLAAAGVVDAAAANAPLARRRAHPAIPGTPSPMPAAVHSWALPDRCLRRCVVAHVGGLGHTRGRALCGALHFAATPALFPVLSPSSPMFSHTRPITRATPPSALCTSTGTMCFRHPLLPSDAWEVCALKCRGFTSHLVLPPRFLPFAPLRLTTTPAK